MMRRDCVRWLGACLVVGLLAAGTGWAAEAAGLFKLSKAIPADAMIVVHARHHDGQKFLDEQMARVWAEVEKQHFDRDIKRFFTAIIKESGGETESFEAEWQQMADLAAGVNWSKLAGQEMAFAGKLGMPVGFEFVLLFMPPAGEVEADYKGLSAMLEHMAGLAPEGVLTFSKDEVDGAQMCKLALVNPAMPIGLTLARCEGVILIGYGPSMTEQCLGLLGKSAEKKAPTLAEGERFQKAFAQLPPPADGMYYVDVSKVVGQLKVFAGMAAAMGAQADEAAESQPAEGVAAKPTKGKLAFLLPLVDSMDLWEYMAGVTTTEGMKTVDEHVIVLREGATGRPLGKALYGGSAPADPLKYVPKVASNVTVFSGLDLPALYQAVLDFLKKEVPDGDELVTKWNEARAEMPFDIEEDLLSWIGGNFVLFSAPIPTPFMPGSVLVIEVRDVKKAEAGLEAISTALNDLLASTEGAGIEDAPQEGLEGFKLVVLPPIMAMIPGLGQPMYGLKDGRLFIANGPKILLQAIEAGASKDDNFAHNERFIQEGLRLPEKMTAFSFEDLSKFGEQLSQGLSMVGMLPMMVPDLAKNPAASSMIAAVTKIGKVVRKLDFYRSACSVTTRNGNVQHTKSIVNYQEPPKPATTEPAADEDSAAEKGKKESTPGE